MEWRDISDSLTVYQVMGSPMDPETKEPVLVATDLGKVFLVIPEEESPGVVRYQVHLSNFWLEDETEGKPLWWAPAPEPPKGILKKLESRAAGKASLIT